jgi:hypothetical protein
MLILVSSPLFGILHPVSLNLARLEPRSGPAHFAREQRLGRKS